MNSYKPCPFVETCAPARAGQKIYKDRFFRLCGPNSGNINLFCTCQVEMWSNAANPIPSGSQLSIGLATEPLGWFEMYGMEHRMPWTEKHPSSSNHVIHLDNSKTTHQESPYVWILWCRLPWTFLWKTSQVKFLPSIFSWIRISKSSFPTVQPIAYEHSIWQCARTLMSMNQLDLPNHLRSHVVLLGVSENGEHEPFE